MEKEETGAKRRQSLGTKSMRNTAVRSLNEMMTDPNLKPADRLNAIKTVLDYTGRLLDEKKNSADRLDDGMLHIVFDNAPKEYSE